MSGKPLSPTSETLRLVMWLCIGVSALTVFWALSGTLTAMIGGLLFCCFLAGPFLLLGFGGRGIKTALARWLLVFAMFAALAFWLWIFLWSYVFVERIDPQVGLIFIFGPIYMVIGASVALFVLRAIDTI